MTTRKKTFYIIDGHSQIFRAYYAPAAFRNRGKGAGAAFIFARMLLKLLQKGKPDAIVCTLDSKGLGFRDEIYKEYKANREPMPEDLSAAMPSIRELIEGMGMPIVEKEGFEADDCIGTLARRAEKEGWQVRIVSRDKDLKQLLSKDVYLFDVDDGSLYGPDELKEDLGLAPEQVVDYLALMGDTSDNIPGAVGVGPKKAQLLLQQYGTLRDVMKHAGDIEQPKMRENLIAFRPQSPISYRLATIVTDVPIDLKLNDAVAKPLERDKLMPILKKQGFNSIIADLGWGDAAQDATASVDAVGARRVAPEPAYIVGAELASPKNTGEASLAPTAPAKGKPKRSAKAAAPDMFGNIEPPTSKIKKSNSKIADSALPTPQAALPAPDLSRYAASKADYKLIDNDEELNAFVKELACHKRIALDTETTGIDPLKADIVGMSFAWEGGHAGYIALRGPKGSKLCSLERAIALVKPILENPKVAKVGQNLKYDILMLKKYGISVRGVTFDTMIAAYLADNTRQQAALDLLARELLGYEGIPIAVLIGADPKHQATMDLVDTRAVATYAGEDVDIALKVADKLAPKLEEEGVAKLSEELEMPLVEVLAEMEFNGIAIDIPYLAELSVEFEKRIEDAAQKCYDLAGREFTINSPKQLGEILFDELGLKPAGKTAGGARSTAVDVLETLAHQHELPRMVLDYRHLTKLKSTYIDALPELADARGRVHTSFRQAVATGRLASTDPNVQNIPVRSEEGKKIRAAFIAQSKDSRLVVADYSQIELRILAHLCGDPTLRAAFEAKRDIHRAVAAEVNGVPEEKVDSDMRSHVKAIHFGILYGQSAFGLSQALGISKSEAQDFIDRYFKRFPKVKSYIERVHKDAERDGYVTTLLGRRRRIEGIFDANVPRKNAAMRQAFNTVVQGSAADLIKMAMLKIHQRIHDEDLPYKLLIQVHDELILEAPKKKADDAAAFLKEEMEGALKLNVPIQADVGIGKNWIEAKP